MKTSKLLKWVALFAGAIIFMGCPYSSTVPLSESGAKIGDNLIGTWELSGTPGTTAEVKRTGSNTVDILKMSEGDTEATTYNAHITDINGTLFLNVKESGDSDYNSYYFYKISKEGEFKLTISPVTTNIRETFENSSDLYKFFSGNMQNSYFYDDGDETYYKVK
ncbi:MAG: hypothetical protein ACKVOR_03395 [Flavobacteriales bacterium]